MEDLWYERGIFDKADWNVGEENIATLRASDNRKIEIYKHFYRRLGTWLPVFNETSTLYLKLLVASFLTYTTHVYYVHYVYQFLLPATRREVRNRFRNETFWNYAYAKDTDINC